MKYNDKFLFSDIDGTLLTEKGEINQRNIDAINSFTANGGNFAIATGRGIFSGRRIARELGANAPCIIYNGAVVYDFKTDEVVSISYLPESGMNLAKTTKVQFPDIRIGIATLEENVEVGAVLPLPPNMDFNPRYGDFDSIKGKWIKVVYHLPKFRMKEVTDFLQSNTKDDIVIVMSGDHYVEILPANCNKGVALENFKSLHSDSKFYAIGDYFNDKEMLIAADVSACPLQALDDIKEISDKVLSHVEDGAVADFIELIENGL